MRRQYKWVLSKDAHVESDFSISLSLSEAKLASVRIDYCVAEDALFKALSDCAKSPATQLARHVTFRNR